MEKIQEEIVIRGGGGTGKTLCANAILRRAVRANLTVEVCDHYLRTFQNSFEKDLVTTRAKHLNTGADLSIIVIDDKGADLQITVTHGLSFDLAQKLFHEPT